jgi:hypothetical protein
MKDNNTRRNTFFIAIKFLVIILFLSLSPRRRRGLKGWKSDDGKSEKTGEITRGGLKGWKNIPLI